MTRLTSSASTSAHWTTWTYKDVGVMGWVTLPPETEYMRVIAPALQAKYDLYSDFWMRWLPLTPAAQEVENLADMIENAIGDPEIDKPANRTYLMQHSPLRLRGQFPAALLRQVLPGHDRKMTSTGSCSPSR